MAFPLKRIVEPAQEPFTLLQMKNYLRVDSDDDDELIVAITCAARERVEDLTGRCLMRQQWQFALDRFPSVYTDYTYMDDYLSISLPRRHSLYLSGRNELFLPRAPLISLDSLSYLDGTGQRQTLDPSQYTVDLLSEPTRVRHARNRSWPTHVCDVNSVVITFTSGYELLVTEQKTVPDSLSVAVDRASDALSLSGVVDESNETPIVGCTLNEGLVTFPSGTAGKLATISYNINNIPKSLLQAMRLICATYYDNRAEVVQGSGNFNQLPVPLSVQSLVSTYELFPVGYPQG